MKTKVKIALALSLLSACSPVPDHDGDIQVTQAALGTPQTFDPPVEWLLRGYSVDAWVGNYIGLSAQVVLYRARETGACTWAVASASAGDWDHDVVVNLSPGSDSFVMTGPNDVLSIACPSGGIPLGPTLKPHGALTVHGGWGDDLISCGLACSMDGGPGNDLLMLGGTVGAGMLGGDGNDCLSSPLVASYRDCGAGSDRYVGPSSGTFGCEAQVSSCFGRFPF